MGVNIWFIFASILLVSRTRARRYDQGPHTFYDFSTGLATAGPYGQRELILYLTTDQLRSLEADGAVVKSDKDDGNDSELSTEQPTNEEQYDENDDAQEENDDSQEEEESDDSQAEDTQPEKESHNIDFEAILRLLNEDQVDEEAAEEQSSDNTRIEEEIFEEPRSFSPRFTFRRQEHEQKNLALAAAKKEQILRTYSNLRYQPYHQRFDYQLPQQDYDTKPPEDFDEKLIGNPIQGTKKYKLVPYKIEEPVDEPIPIVNAQQQNSKAEEKVRTAKTNKLLRDELLKYAIRVQKLRDSEKTRAAARANSKDSVVSTLIKQQKSRKQSKIGKAPVRSVDNKQTKSLQPKSIAVPVMVAEKSAVQKSIKIPVETSKLVRNKPYIATRRVNANKKTNTGRSSK